MQFVELDPKEFTKFADSHQDKSFFQTTKIAALREQNGWQAHYVGVKQGEKILAASLIVSKTTFAGHKTFYAPGGPLIDFEDQKLLDFFVQNLKIYLKKHKAYVFHIDPYYELIERDRDGNVKPDGFNHQAAADNLKKLGFKPLKVSEQPKYLFALDLNFKNEAEMLDSFKSNTRNKINKTLKHGIKIHELKKSELPRFKEITAATSRRRGFTDKPESYYTTMYDLFGDQVKFVLAEIDLAEYRESLNSSLSSLEKELENIKKECEKVAKIENPDNQTKKKLARLENSQKPVLAAIEDAKNRLADAAKITDKTLDLSAAMFILYGDEVIYLFSGSYEEYMKFDAQYTIQWYMLKYALKNGYKRYNFYGIQGLPDPKKPDYGVYEFKKGFGGRVIELLGSYELGLSPLYSLHKLLSKLKSLV